MLNYEFSDYKTNAVNYVATGLSYTATFLDSSPLPAWMGYDGVRGFSFYSTDNDHADVDYTILITATEIGSRALFNNT